MDILYAERASHVKRFEQESFAFLAAIASLCKYGTYLIMGRLVSILREVSLQDEVLKIVRNEIAVRQWPDVEIARRAGWSQSRMSRALYTPRKLTVNDLETILIALGIEAGEITQAFVALVQGEAAVPAQPSRSAESMLSNPPDWARFFLEHISMRTRLEEYAEELKFVKSELAKRGGSKGG